MKFWENLRQNPLKLGLILACAIIWVALGTVAVIAFTRPTAEPKTPPVIPAPIAPIISNISVADIKETTATISWTTDVPTTGEVQYWTTAGTENITLKADGLAASHSIPLKDLKMETAYSFRIKARSAAGNESSAALQGTFSTNALVIPVAPEVGYKAPDFLLQDTGGKSQKLSNYAGKWLMLTFWETTCPACRAEMPDLQNFHQNMAAGRINLVAINVKETNDVLLLSFINQRGLTFPVLLDRDGAILDLYKVELYPTAFFIDPRGVIRKVIAKRFESAEEIAITVNALIGN